MAAAAAGDIEASEDGGRHHHCSCSSMQPTMRCGWECAEAPEQCRGGNQQVLWRLVCRRAGTVAQHTSKIPAGQESEVRCGLRLTACGASELWSAHCGQGGSRTISNEWCVQDERQLMHYKQQGMSAQSNATGPSYSDAQVGL